MSSIKFEQSGSKFEVSQTNFSLKHRPNVYKKYLVKSQSYENRNAT